VDDYYTYNPLTWDEIFIVSFFTLIAVFLIFMLYSAISESRDKKHAKELETWRKERKADIKSDLASAGIAPWDDDEIDIDGETLLIDCGLADVSLDLEEVDDKWAAFLWYDNGDRVRVSRVDIDNLRVQLTGLGNSFRSSLRSPAQ
jgi:hypothetical protein